MTSPAPRVLPASRIVNRPRALQFEYKSRQTGFSSVMMTVAETVLVRHLKWSKNGVEDFCLLGLLLFNFSSLRINNFDELFDTSRLVDALHVQDKLGLLGWLFSGTILGCLVAMEV